jgi:hypothetical protein
MAIFWCLMVSMCVVSRQFVLSRRRGG